MLHLVFLPPPLSVKVLNCKMPRVPAPPFLAAPRNPHGRLIWQLGCNLGIIMTKPTAGGATAATPIFFEEGAALYFRFSSYAIYVWRGGKVSWPFKL